MTDERILAIVFVFFVVMGALLVWYPMTMARHTVTERQWEQIERANPASVSAVVRFIGVAWIVMGLLALQTLAR
jgi:hypothetical protein